METIESIIDRLKEERDVIRGPIKKPRKGPRKLVEANTKKRKGKLTESRRLKHNAFWAGIDGTYKHLVKTYRSRAKDREKRGLKPVSFLLSLEEWRRVWTEAGYTREGGQAISYFALRGKRKQDAKLYRIDENKPWELRNVVVVYKGQAIWNGRDVR